jgi:hypothetical protein
MMVNTLDWDIPIPGASTAARTSAVELLLALSANRIEAGDVQVRTWRALEQDPFAKEWHKQRTFLKDAKHFARYRGTAYDVYHSAARATASGMATAEQHASVAGLNNEIALSKLVIPIGQVLFHGRANDDLRVLRPYTSFISTSLDPVVAMNSSLRRGGINARSGRPTVHVLTLRDPLNALWGNTGRRPVEWEVLLQSGLRFACTRSHAGGNFDVVEGTLGF